MQLNDNTFRLTFRNNKKIYIMKQILMALTVALTLSTSMQAGVRLHRHTPRTEAAVTKADSAKNQGVEAFSDTTSNYNKAVDDTTYTSSPARNYDHDYDFDSSNWFVKAMAGAMGAGGIIIVVLILLLGALICLAPLIIVILVIRYLFKRHNDSVKLAEKAMETGQPIPSAVRPSKIYTNEEQWQRGIKNASIGLGLMILFWFISADAIIGVGALILCMGIGQMLIARTSPNKHNDADNDSDTDFKA